MEQYVFTEKHTKNAIFHTLKQNKMLQNSRLKTFYRCDIWVKSFSGSSISFHRSLKSAKEHGLAFALDGETVEVQKFKSKTCDLDGWVNCPDIHVASVFYSKKVL